jgi:hypothetical protein
MDHFYDGQIRRYVTQFMRVFIGFKYKAGDGTETTVPVKYGDMTRQVAAIIKENSENKMPTVPQIACYITGLEMDTTRLSDASFVSKVHIRERRYLDAGGEREYQNVQGGNYTVERLMPTPFKLSMKADIWTSNTDQKLQLMEQILVLFNPSLELQTTDNYIDWTSLSVLNLGNISFTSRSIPAGAETEIDICSMEFDMPIYISPPSKVKKLGIVQTVISNVFTESGDVVNLEELVYNRQKGGFGLSTNNYRVLLFKSNSGNVSDGQYDLTILNKDAAALALGLYEKTTAVDGLLDWNTILEVQGGYKPSSYVYFKKPSGGEIVGQFVVNPLDPTILSVSIDRDSLPGNTDIPSTISGVGSRGTVDAVIDPYKFNPLEVFGSHSQITLGVRYLMLDDVNNSANRGDFVKYPFDPSDGSSKDPYRGPQGWTNSNSSDPIITANSIIEWNGNSWVTVWDPTEAEPSTYIQNIRTGIQYIWDGEQWLKSFEGEYSPGNWNFVIQG